MARSLRNTVARDTEAMASALARWLRHRLDADAVRVLDVTRPDGSGGSNETYLARVEVDAPQGRVNESVVIRVSSGAGSAAYFATVDDTSHRRLLTGLGSAPELLAPRVLWWSESSDVLGAPFWIMRKVDGWVPTDWPPYNTEGHLFSLPVAERAAVWRSAVEAMARVHRYTGPEAALLSRTRPGQSELSAQFDWWRTVVESTRPPQGTPDPVVRLEKRLETTLPATPVDGLSWGDARIGNMIFHGTECRAVLDWEMASLGGAELDLAWWLLLDWWDGPARGLERLEGLGDREETIGLWQDLVGREVRDLPWHEGFALYRMVGVIQAWAKQSPSAKATSYALDNPVIERVRDSL